MSVGLLTRGMISVGVATAAEVVAENIEVDVEETMTTDDVEVSETETIDVDVESC